jgi:hypothetical protein
MDNVTGGRRKLRHEKLHNLYSSPNNAGNITMLNQRVWGEGTRNLSNEYKIMVKNLTGRDHLEDLNADGTIILKWILKEVELEDMHWLRIGTSDRLF